VGHGKIELRAIVGLRLIFQGAGVEKSQDEHQTFEKLAPALQAAWRWIDAFSVVGGAWPEHPSSLDGLGWTWEEFGQTLKTYREGNPSERLDEAVALLHEWIDEAFEEEEATDLLRGSMSWCFADREVEDGVVFFYLWPSAAPMLEFEGIAMPAPEQSFESQEGLWEIHTAEPDPGKARARVWDRLAEEFFVFDVQTQKNGEKARYAYFNTLEEDPAGFWLEIQRQIPALAADKEAEALAALANAGAKSPKRPAL
jgi:hypothetical protein